MKKYILFYSNLDEIYDDKAFIAIIDYPGSSKKQFLRHIYISIGIPGDSENYDALYDDYRSFYWIHDKEKVFLVHNSLPNNKEIIDMYFDILFSSIYDHIAYPEMYVRYIDGEGYIHNPKKIIAYFQMRDKPIIEMMYNKFLNSDTYRYEYSQLNKLNKQIIQTK